MVQLYNLIFIFVILIFHFPFQISGNLEVNFLQTKMNEIETIPVVKLAKRFSIKLNYINSGKNYPIMELERGVYRITIEEQVDDPYYVVGDIIVGNGMKYLEGKLGNSGVHNILAVIEMNQNMLEMRFRFDFAQNPFFIPEEEIEILREFNFKISWIKF